MASVSFYSKKSKSKVSFHSAPKKRSTAKPTPAQAAARKSFVENFAYATGRAVARGKAAKAKDRPKVGFKHTRTGVKKAAHFAAGFSEGYQSKPKPSPVTAPPSPAQQAARRSFIQRFAGAAGRGYAAYKEQKKDYHPSKSTRGLSRGIAFGIGFKQGYRGEKGTKYVQRK